MLEHLLDYWHSLEFFQPSWPIKEKEDTNLHKKPLPWPLAQPNPDIQISHDIYLGCTSAFDLITWCLGRLGLIMEDSPIERDQSKCCLCAFKVNENGVYVAGSFAVSSFAWALGTMVQSNDFGRKLNLDDLEIFQSRITTAISANNDPFSLEEIKTIFEKVRNEVGIESGIFSPSIWARTKIQYRKKDGTFPALDPSTELMSSYYVREIARIRKNPGKQVKQYAEALHNEPPNRTSIDTDVSAMKQWLSADFFPRGTWPSAFSPSLMQQLAINLAISSQDIFSVNGPPGTGKTTLLKEIIASNIVQRAALLAEYNKPDDAFHKDEFKHPPDQYNRSFYHPDNAITAFGMLVTSNNNAAVENISVELPKAVKKDRSGRFTGADDTAETYFADIATALLDEPAWGLISARLGKKKNLGELKDRLWWADDGNTLKKYYDQLPPDWESARQNFFTAWKAVEEEQKKITKVQEMVADYAITIESENTILTEIKRLQAQIDTQSRFLNEQQAVLENFEKELSLHQQNVHTLQSGISFFKRTFCKNNIVVQEWKREKQQCEETLIAITHQRTALQAQAGNLELVAHQLQQQETILQNVQEKKRQQEAGLEPEKKRFASNYADDAFWQDIISNENSQAACPWTYNDYDTLREELFYRALMLQKAFVLGSNCVKQNLNRLFAMWEGRFTLTDRELSYGSLLNTLFFVVPVISTTFASVQSFLEGVQLGELGILIVDESGQATPQSALGSLWRTRKAIIVGDPLQVEPIMTTPLELCKRFADDNNLPAIYRIPELSVQMLADAQNPYGGMRQMDDEPLWLGCPLIVHRRCIDPIFSMSNHVAYNGRMFCKTEPPSANKQFLLERSVWFDIPGAEIGGKNHTVPDQIDLVIYLIQKAIAQFGGLPDIYIITPFTSVKRSLEQKLRALLRKLLPEMDLHAIHNWIDESCGTIHTFQGKEANEVLLILGCDRQQGLGAARWVGQKPNIINVAVSRAKYRVGVIGDYDLWNSIPYVQVVCKMLSHAVVTNNIYVEK